MFPTKEIFTTLGMLIFCQSDWHYMNARDSVRLFFAEKSLS